MAFLRNSNRERYTTIDNVAIRDDSLSLKALGLLVKLLSFPDNWEFSENGLDAIFKKDGQASIRSGLKELEIYGYLRRYKVRDSKGRIIKVEWEITENPRFDYPQLGNPSLDNPSLENQPQYNTNQLNTKELKTKEINTDMGERPKKQEYRWQDDADISQKMASAISDWLEYKKERREAYKPVGLKSLITEIKNNIAKYGEDAVIGVMVSSMGSGYKGICFDKLKPRGWQKQDDGNPFLEIAKEEHEKKVKYGPGRNSEDYVTV